MAFRFDVPANGDLPAFTVTVNTPAEASAMVQALRTHVMPAPSATPPAGVYVYANRVPADDSAGDMPLGLRIVSAIRDAGPNGISTDALCHMFSLETGRSLGGAMIGINRKLEQAGIPPIEAFTYVRLRPGEGSMWYAGARIEEAIKRLSGERMLEILDRAVHGIPKADNYKIS